MDRHRRHPESGSLRYFNTSGVESVGSMVVYEDGKPKRSDYRKFKIRTVQGTKRLRIYGRGADPLVLPRNKAGEQGTWEEGRIFPMEVSRFPDLIYDGWR